MRLCLITCVMLGFLASCSGNASNAPGGNQAAVAPCSGAQPSIPACTVPASPEQLSEIRLFFDGFGAAGRSRNVDALLALIDVPMALAAAEAQGAFRVSSEAERAQTVTELQESARSTWLKDANDGFAFDRAVVLKATLSPDGRFAVASANVSLPSFSRRVRWWLTRGPDGWQAYDWEDVDWGLRSSWLLANSMAQPDRAGSWQSRANYMQVARTKYIEGNIDGAREYLILAKDKSLPTELEAVRLAQLADCEARESDHTAAVQLCDEALRLMPELPAALYIRASACFELKKYERALADLQAYSGKIGDDAIVLLGKANCLVELERKSEARTLFERSLEIEATPFALSGLAACLDPADLASLGKWFGKMANKRGAFAYLMEDVLYRRQLYAAAEEIIGAYTEAGKDDFNLHFARGRLLLAQDKPAQAITCFQDAYGLAGPAQREEILKWQLDAHYRAGDGARAIAGTKNPQLAAYAFRVLANRYLQDGDAEGLNQMCEAWAPRGKEDAYLFYFRGETLALQKDWSGAEAEFRKGLGLQSTDDQIRPSLRRAVLLTMCRQNRALDAYKEWECSDEEFGLIAREVFDTKDAEVLEKLVSAHAAVGGRFLHRVRGDVAWLREDWKAASVHYSKYANYMYDDDPGYAAAIERFVRSCIRSDNAETGIKWAKAAFSEPDDRVLAIAAAGANLPGTATNALFRLAKRNAGPDFMTAYYDDPDVGEKLRTADYAKLHERFPPPSRE